MTQVWCILSFSLVYTLLKVEYIHLSSAGSGLNKHQQDMNYSKFDKIDYDAESDDEATHQSNMPVKVTTTDKAGGTSAPGAPLGVDGNPLPTKMTGKTKEGRLKFEYQGRTIYEWEQSLDEVNIYLNPPPGLPSKMIDISITHTHLTIGVKDTPPFIDEDLGGPVKVDECTWTLSDGELNISLCKMNKAETWVKALSGRDGAEVDPVTKEELRKQMMLERFQEEHPGFDFSGADFNGTVPEAREFMGGVQR